MSDLSVDCFQSQVDCDPALHEAATDCICWALYSAEVKLAML